MGKVLRDLRPVYVVGVGLHRYQHKSDTPYVELGLTAVREALSDAGIAWPSVEAVYTGTAQLGIAPTRIMLRHLGTTGIPMTQVENASASGSSAFRQACLEVAGGVSDVVLAMGIDKPEGLKLASRKAGVPDLVGSRSVPFTHFALLANAYMHRHNVGPETIAAVAVKNHRNGANNPYAQRQKERTLEEVLDGPSISGSLTRLQCCPVGEGAAAVIVVSEEAMQRLGINRARAIRVLASTTRTERVYSGGKNFDAELTRETVTQSYDEADITPADLDVIELHDAFSIE